MTTLIVALCALASNCCHDYSEYSDATLASHADANILDVDWWYSDPNYHFTIEREDGVYYVYDDDHDLIGVLNPPGVNPAPVYHQVIVTIELDSSGNIAVSFLLEMQYVIVTAW